MKKIMSLFSNNKPKKINYSDISINDIHPFEIPLLTADEIIDLLKIQNKIRRIRYVVALDDVRFDELYLSPLHKYFESVQLIPASLSHHHSHLGGLIIHTLDVLEIALGIRNTYTLPRLADPDVQQRERHLWTYGVFVATLLHDIGKTLTQQSLVFLDSHKTFSPIEFKYEPSKYRMIPLDLKESYRIHETLSPMFFGILIPPKGQDWLTRNISLLDQIFSYLKGDKSHEGIIGEIVTKADMKSAASDVGFEKTDSLPFAKKSLSDRIIFAIKELLPTYNINSAGNSTVYKKGEYAWVMSNILAEDIKKFISKQNESVPSDNSKIFNEIQNSGIALSINGRLIQSINVSAEKYDGTLFSHNDFKVIGLKVRSVFNDANVPDDLIGSIFCPAAPEIYPIKNEINKIDAISPFMQNLEDVSDKPKATPKKKPSPSPKQKKVEQEKPLQADPIEPTLEQDFSFDPIFENTNNSEPDFTEGKPSLEQDLFESNEPISTDSSESISNDNIEPISNDSSEPISNEFTPETISQDNSGEPISNDSSEPTPKNYPDRTLKLKNINSFDAKNFRDLPDDMDFKSKDFFIFFTEWVRENLRSKRFILNDNTSPFHLISESLFGLLAPKAYGVFIDDYKLNIDHATLQQYLYKHKLFYSHQAFSGRKLNVFTVNIVNSSISLNFNIIHSKHVLPHDLKVNTNKSFILKETPIEPDAVLRERSKKMAKKKSSERMKAKNNKDNNDD